MGNGEAIKQQPYLHHAEDIQAEINRRKAQLEWLNNDPPSAQIQREIDRRKAERARCKARLKLVAPAEQQEQEKTESVKNREED